MKIEEVKIHIFWDTCWNSFKFSGKMWLMLILKVTLKTNLYTLSLQTIYFLKYILKVKAWIFFNWNFNIIFSKLAIFHSIQIKTSLKKKTVRKITREKVWRPIYGFWYLLMYVTYVKILAYVRDHVWWFYDNCWTLALH